MNESIDTYLRQLDIDDLIILSLLSKPNVTISSISQDLSTTPAAVSIRFRKYRETIPRFKAERVGGSYVLNKNTLDVCKKAQQALDTLAEYNSIHTHRKEIKSKVAFTLEGSGLNVKVKKDLEGGIEDIRKDLHRMVDNFCDTEKSTKVLC